MTTQDEIEKHIDEILLGGGGHTWQRRQIIKLLAAHDKEIVRQAEIRARIGVWEAVKYCVENNGDNTQRLLRFHLPDFDKNIAALEQQLYLNEEEKDE